MGLWDLLNRAAELAADATERAQIEQARRSGDDEGYYQLRVARDDRLARRPDSPAYQHGRNDVPTAIVLSAPGRHEEKAGRPAAGQTGKHLQKTLEKLSQVEPELFPSTDPRDYRIVNAVDDVHYKKKTGRTEANVNEINAPRNRERLAGSLKDKPSILALGSKAKAAVKAAGREPTLSGAHASPQVLNTKYKSEAGTAKDRAEERISAYAADIRRSRAPPPKKK